MKGKNRDMTNVGHFAVLLARCCYFGDDLQIPVTKAMDDRLHNGGPLGRDPPLGYNRRTELWINHGH